MNRDFSNNLLLLKKKILINFIQFYQAGPLFS